MPPPSSTVAPRRLDLVLAVDPRRTRRWMARLAEKLAAAGHRVGVRHVEGAGPPPVSLELLRALEDLLHRRAGPRPGDRIDLSSAPESPAPDLVLDLSGRASPGSGRTLRPVFAGGATEETFAAALAGGDEPVLGITDSAAPGRASRVRIAVENQLILAQGMDEAGARMATLLAAAVAAVARGDDIPALEPLAAGRAWSPAAAAGVIAAKLRARLAHALAEPVHWYVGWRRCDEDRLARRKALPEHGWTRLPDDRKRFYADPLVFHHQGATALFVEDFEFATGRGRLSVTPFGAEGPNGPARPIVETPYHLSYPFVFADAGEVWLVPETSAERRVDLYRCTRFPDAWAYEGTLLDGVAASDSTIVRHGGALFLFATVAEDGASSWDALHLWTAERVEGPWRPVGDGPVFIGALGARPGGALYRHDGALWRPAQDCRTGYGSGLALARIDRLDSGGFAQAIDTVLAPGGAWPGDAMHTVNWANGIEVVDGCRRGAR
jgi:hypothetical protein